MREWVEEYVKKLRTVHGKTFIFGAGITGKIVLNLCNDYGFDIEGFVVSDKKDNLSVVNGKTVYEIGDIKDNLGEITILIAVLERGNKGVIEKELASLGCKSIVPLPEEIREYTDDGERYYHRPLMEITPKIGCSVNCNYCPQKLLISKYCEKQRDKSMSFENFKTCVDKLPRDTYIAFAGFVEPFLNEDAVKMIKYAYDSGFEISLFTTLVGMTKEKFDEIKDIPFRQVSLHVADEDNYAYIPVTEEYIELVKLVTSYIRSDGKQFVEELNCQSNPHPLVRDIVEGRVRIYNELNDRCGSLEGKNTDNQLYSAYHSGKLECGRCGDLNHNVLLPDGTVVLCCNDFGMKHVFGNLLEQSYEEICNCKEKQLIKDNMQGMDTGKEIICRKCTYAREL